MPLLSIPVYENVSIVTESVGMNVDLKYWKENFLYIKKEQTLRMEVESL